MFMKYNKMQKRYILLWMLLLMMVANTLVTICINIAIVSMVDFHEESENSDITCPNTTFFLKGFLDNGNDEEEIPFFSEKTVTYKWSKEEQNKVLAGYYWLNYISILPAGILAHKFGAKTVAGYGQLIASCMCSLIPVSASYGPIAVAWIRAVQGVLSFMAVPAGFYTIIGSWGPPQERGKFGATAIVGSGLGQTLGNVCFGYIAQYFHWQYVFHITSVIGVVWAILWYMLVYASPAEHPTITEEERNYIESHIQHTDSPKRRNIPWKDIITSVPFLVCTLASNSTIWVFVMMATYTPLYLKSTYGLNSDEIGIITSVCLFSTMVSGLVVGYLSDVFIQRGILSLNMMRKMCTLLGCVISGIPLIVAAFVKCNINVIIICILLVAFLRGGGMYGASLGIVDVSPKFSGILEGICGTSGSIQAFIFSVAVSYYSAILSFEELWKVVFIFTASYSILANVLYMIFGSSEVQSWSFDNHSNATDPKPQENIKE